MSQLLYGSLDFSKLLELAKKGDKSFSKHENGKIYLNVKVWINDEKDQFGNDASIQTSFKDASKEERHYFGNMKLSEPTQQPLQEGSDEIPEESELPF